MDYKTKYLILKHAFNEDVISVMELISHNSLLTQNECLKVATFVEEYNIEGLIAFLDSKNES